MTTVAPTHTYPAGSSLNAAGHAGNMYNSTPQQGIYSAVNGELDFSNNYNGTVQRHNFQASEMFFFDQYQWDRPITVFDDTGGGSNVQEADPAPTMIGLRFSLPAKAKSFRVGYSFFLSASRPYKVERQDTSTAQKYKWVQANSIEARLMVYHNGVEQQGLRIPLPRTLWGGLTATSGGGASNHLNSFEHLTGHQHTGSFIVVDNTSLNHDIQFKLFLESPAANGAFNFIMGKTLGLIGKSQDLKLKLSQRLTFGCGQVNVVAKGLKVT